ncbi:hypothetical protein NA57DRAFT_26564, partial [Rhizodiscina lignyota]
TSTPSFAEAQSYPLYPSVQHLLHENNISEDEANKIPASGPNGRLLKGDVLAYLGQIDKSYPLEQSKRLDKLSHLDLSNIKLAAPKKPADAAAAPPTLLPEEPAETEVAVPISLAAALACQKRIQDTLGISLPLSTFIARAIEMANDDLPSAKAKPTADELFHAVLGHDVPQKAFSRGSYVPQIVALPPAPDAGLRMLPPKKPDIIDILAPKSTKAPQFKTIGTIPGASGVAAAQNVFSVTAGKGEEKRVSVFLERMKTILEMEPGRLVL